MIKSRSVNYLEKCEFETWSAIFLSPWSRSSHNLRHILFLFFDQFFSYFSNFSKFVKNCWECERKEETSLEGKKVKKKYVCDVNNLSTNPTPSRKLYFLCILPLYLDQETIYRSPRPHKRRRAKGRGGWRGGGEEGEILAEHREYFTD